VVCHKLFSDVSAAIGTAPLMDFLALSQASCGIRTWIPVFFCVGQRFHDFPMVAFGFTILVAITFGWDTSPLPLFMAMSLGLARGLPR
jgi:hypothetical protein